MLILHISPLFSPFCHEIISYHCAQQIKQMIERLNRTYRFHTKAACGFKEPNNLVSLVALFATHYNFLKPHKALNYDVPCPLDELKNIPTIQNKWAKILHIATSLA